uniref:Uncharacterized protein n=1 Tax=Setaria viridis TaxID=4556 RepID=A0A4U6W2M4_SETVI|nr:hypothetical protein SEVIR_2G329600v2 [Setaria viridis]
MRERLPVRKQRRRRTSQRHASTVKERGGGGRLIGWRCAYDFIALMISSWSSCSRSSAVQDEAVPNVQVPQGVHAHDVREVPLPAGAGGRPAHHAPRARPRRAGPAEQLLQHLAGTNQRYIEAQG